MNEEDLTNYKRYINNLDIIKYCIKDDEDNYWYSTEYVDEMLKEQDKEIERLNDKEQQLIRRLEDFIIVGEEVENEWAVDICKMIIEELKGEKDEKDEKEI